MSKTAHSKCFLATVGDDLSPMAKGALVLGTIGFFGCAIMDSSRGSLDPNKPYLDIVTMGITLLAIGVGAIGLPAILAMIERIRPSNEAAAEEDDLRYLI